MNWYLIHTKPRQEQRALLNLEQQGFSCYLPLVPAVAPGQAARHGGSDVVSVPLFPRYLFIRLSESSSGPGWGVIRSTKGVSRLVMFGNVPARVDNALIEALHAREHVGSTTVRPLFAAGDRVRIKDGAFEGLEAVYQMEDGDCRVIVLMELLSRPMSMRLPASSVQKIG
ncbi:transcription/translation regulatory transformer protein RfaH [Pandoraea sp. NPDC087047]|uniref:transcription/translation regulatory transformer protein RfaH n=1 Tax=Pandoraea sp. NPDC087047 TaxID=3364390 RepID=UPI0038029CB4